MLWLQGAENMKELLKTTEEGEKKIKHSLLFPLISSLFLSPSLSSDFTDSQALSVSHWQDYEFLGRYTVHIGTLITTSRGGSILNPLQGLNGLLLMHEQQVIPNKDCNRVKVII